jgi:proline iminopeptidase
MRNFLYPELQPYSQCYLNVTPPHSLYVEECGNPNGLPVIFIHGGPGSGCSENDRRFFDPDKYRIILFDQRGCGRSKPLALIENNTTDDLVNDIEIIREHLSIRRWIVFGGSWGSTLSLVYAESNPEPVLSLVLRGIFLGTREEIDHLNEGGMSRFYPEEYLAYKNFIAIEDQGNLHCAYYEIMKYSEPEEKIKAAESFVKWDMRGISLDCPPADLINTGDNPDKLVAEALIQCHYMFHNCFLIPDQIMSNTSKITHVPTTIVHGRYDMLCAPQKAYDLHSALANAELFFAQRAGHASRDEGTGEKLVETMDKLAQNSIAEIAEL